MFGPHCMGGGDLHTPATFHPSCNTPCLFCSSAVRPCLYLLPFFMLPGPLVGSHYLPPAAEGLPCTGALFCNISQHACAAGQPPLDGHAPWHHARRHHAQKHAQPGQAPLVLAPLRVAAASGTTKLGGRQQMGSRAQSSRHLHVLRGNTTRGRLSACLRRASDCLFWRDLVSHARRAAG